MHKHFGDWYREAAIEPSTDQLESRWKGVEAFTKSRKDRSQKLIELIRVFYELPPTDEEFAERFRSAFQSIDQTFPMRGNDFEVRVLAGSSLANMIAKGSNEQRDFAALACLCSWSQGLRDNLPIDDLPKIAEEHLFQVAAGRYSTEEPPSIKGSAPDVEDNVAAFQNAIQQNEIPQIAEPISNSLTQMSSSAAAFMSSAEAAFEWLASNLKLQQEETNILWWLYSETSNSLNQPFSGFQAAFASLIAGDELADLVAIIPGPLASRAIIHRALSNVNEEIPEKASIQEAVAQAPLEWIKSIAKRSIRDLEDILPVHSAIRAAAESDGAKGSIKALQKRIKAKVNTGIPTESLGLQMYYERLFLKAFILAE